MKFDQSKFSVNDPLNFLFFSCLHLKIKLKFSKLFTSLSAFAMQLLTSKAHFLEKCTGNRRAFLRTLFIIDSELNNRFCGIYTTLLVLFEIACYAYAVCSTDFYRKILQLKIRYLAFCSMSRCVGRGSRFMGAIFCEK